MLYVEYNFSIILEVPDMVIPTLNSEISSNEYEG